MARDPRRTQGLRPQRLRRDRGPSTDAAERVADLLDLFFDEQGTPFTGRAKDRWIGRTQRIADATFPRQSEDELLDLLRERRFLVLKRPPGTSKTRLAYRLASRIAVGLLPPSGKASPSRCAPATSASPTPTPPTSTCS